MKMRTGQSGYLKGEPLTKQRRLVLEWLLAGRKITQQYATRRGVERLGARIYELKKFHGAWIVDRMIQVRKQSNQKTAWVKEYGMESFERKRVRQALREGLEVRVSPIREDREAETGTAASIVPEPEAAVRPVPPETSDERKKEKLTPKKGGTGDDLLWDDANQPCGYD